VPIDHSQWKPPFKREELPQWLCPECHSGQLELVEDSFKEQELLCSRNANEEGDVDWHKHSYSTLFECSKKQCRESFSSCGYFEVFITYDSGEFEGKNYNDLKMCDFRLTPEYFYPSLDIFPIPSTCPESVAKEIKLSFQLFFCSPAASGNHIRKSIENILTDKGVKRFGVSKKNHKRTPINLNCRINIYKSKNSSVADHMLAIKWIGNEGSHGELSRDDVLDAYDILEFILDELYVGHGKALKKKVLMINKRKKSLSGAKSS
jgi:Domain of unknown function (DUF4145)